MIAAFGYQPILLPGMLCTVVERVEVDERQSGVLLKEKLYSGENDTFVMWMM